MFRFVSEAQDSHKKNNDDNDNDNRMRKKTDQKRESIVEVANKVFLEAGYERASMGQIAERMCGSKATIYGYFQSKEALFVEAMLHTGGREFPHALDRLEASGDNLPVALQNFGETFLRITCQPEFVAGRRVVQAESGQSEVGRLFHESGPRIAETLVGRFLETKMRAGTLRRSDPLVATQQLFALLEAQTLHRFMLGIETTISKPEIRRLVARAVDTFMRAYAVEGSVVAAAGSAPAAKKTTRPRTAKRAASVKR